MTTTTPAFPTAGLTILDQAPAALRANPRNARTHSKKQIGKIADSIRAFGFTVPLVVDETGLVLAGHGRLLAAKQLGLPTVPTVRLDHLSETQKRAYAIADNKIATLAGWDRATLALELGELAIHLPEIGFDLSVTGFEIAELDLLTGGLEEERLASREDEQHEPEAPVSQLGDLWQLGSHRILCGSACSRDDVERLMDGRAADMVFTDPPYNVPVNGHVMGRGRVQHREFVMGSGEMTEEAFTAFLTESLGNAVSVSRDGALHYVCMDWRHLPELHAATRTLYGEQKNLIVWSKTNPGQGSLYRSQHELIALYKVGTASHTNNVELGRHGRNRSNVWTYSGVNTFKGAGDLALHPTVKPVALVVDAIKDVTRRGAIILDPFSGSGTTLLAAEKTAREARVLELDPVYVDVAIRRWQAFTGRDASPELKREIEALASLDLGDLRIRWRQHLRTAPPPHLSRPLMVRLLAYRIQAKVLGDLDRDSARLLDRIAKERLRRRAADERAAKPKAPPIVPPIPVPGLRPGTLLVREFGGEVHTVTVVAGGFALKETTYASLSEVARAITGTRWNGPRFFGLRDKVPIRTPSGAGEASIAMTLRGIA